jgi:hypothetical protein
MQIKIPEQYKTIIEEFTLQYYERRRWELEQGFLGIQISIIDMDVIQGSALAAQLAEIARAAAGELEHTDDGWTEGVVYEGIQDLCERLFSPPGLGAAYTIPRDFWESPLGQMVGRAFIWTKNDQLITQAEAAKIKGVTTQAISNAVREGRLIGYIDPDAPERQGRTLVSKADVENM